jgi:hypothetical protein
MRDFFVLLLATLLAGPSAAQHDHTHHGAAAAAAPPAQRPAAREWTRQPVLVAAMNRGGDRSAASLRPQNIEAAELVVFSAGGPDERRRVAYPIAEGGAKIESATPKVGNYHWVVARQESEAEVRVASTVWYFSNPGPAPTKLLKQPKHELEIVPSPLPREHSTYREAEKREFLVRWNGAPLAGKTLTLETEFGSRSSYVTDTQGLATVLLPRDIRESKVRAGEESMMGPQRGKFVLGVEHEADGKRYLTAFNYTYSPDSDRTRSLAWGTAFGVLGMVVALPLLRRRATTDSTEKKNA